MRALADVVVGNDIHRLRLPVGGRPPQRRHGLSGRRGRLRRRSGGDVRDGNEIGARLPLGMPLQRLATRGAAGVALLVVEPKRHAHCVGLVDDMLVGLPRLGRFEVIREAHIPHEAAKAIPAQCVELGVRLREVIRATMVDGKDTRRSGGIRETDLPRSVFRRVDRLAGDTRERRGE